MSDISLKIMDRTYRLSVPAENAEKLRRCGEELDRRMLRIRESGRVLGYDQIAVMVALDLVWAEFDMNEALEDGRKQTEDASARMEQMRAACAEALAESAPAQTESEAAAAQQQTSGAPAPSVTEEVLPENSAVP